MQVKEEALTHSTESGASMVRVENISKSFDHFQALKNVSFEVKKGEVLGFLGPNGAGKTTTVRILTGFFPPSEGKVWIGDKELSKDSCNLKQKIGYLPETVQLYSDMRVEEFLSFVASLKGVSRKIKKAHVEEKITRCGLWDVRRRMIGHLSKGYRQRVGLAQAIMGDPDVMVLDEPTTGLDPKQNVEIRALIRELGKERTLILSTHILPEVSMVCDRVLIMNQGRVVATGTTDELEAGLKKRQSIFVAMGDPSRSKEVFELLEKISEIERVAVVEEAKDQISYSLTAKQDQDLRPEITRLFVEKGIPLLEIRKGRLSLEEIFMKLVLNEDVPNETLL